MAKTADATGIHFKMLNSSKGPAVRSPRCQSDKHQYSEMMQKIMLQSSCTLIEGKVDRFNFSGSHLSGVTLKDGTRLKSGKVIVCSGTYLNGLIHRGENRISAGRIDEPSSISMAKNLAEMGHSLRRLKTGTPPRVKASSVNFEQVEIQHEDVHPSPFSFQTTQLKSPAVPCHITYTNEKTHALILQHKEEIPLFNGQISGKGPRYCPSIEDKVFRFQDKIRHQIFLEPESLRSEEIYLNGISTSMDQKLQEEMLHTIRGLQKAEVIRYGYAIEYDYVPPHQISATMESRVIPGLYLAGQINGTTGYEEAAAQGLIAGINAFKALDHSPPFILNRDEAYIGVLIDDLITKEILEPYRMFTSRAEHRLMLRQDNADWRLMPKGFDLGLIPEKVYQKMQRKYEKVEHLELELQNNFHDGISLGAMLRKPENHIEDIVNLNLKCFDFDDAEKEVLDSLEISVKYRGYLQREKKRINRLKKINEVVLPRNIDYHALTQMRLEGRDKLSHFRPLTLGQAARIAGVNPVDIQILEVILKKRRWPILPQPQLK